MPDSTPESDAVTYGTIASTIKLKISLLHFNGTGEDKTKEKRAKQNGAEEKQKELNTTEQGICDAPMDPHSPQCTTLLTGRRGGLPYFFMPLLGVGMKSIRVPWNMCIWWESISFIRKAASENSAGTDTGGSSASEEV
jgi:hypothetical protein